MGTEDQLNSKILQTVADTNASVLGQSRAESMAVGFEALAHSLALVMHNSGSAQYSAQQLEMVIVSRTCADILDSIKDS